MSLDIIFMEIRSLIPEIELIIIELIPLVFLIKHFWHVLMQKD